KMNDSLVQTTNYTDSCILYKGEYEYMVKAVSLIDNFSGSYFNESLGINGTIEIMSNKLLETPIADYSQQGETLLTFEHSNKWASSIIWIIDGEHKTENPYVLTLPLGANDTAISYSVIVSNACDQKESQTKLIIIKSGINDLMSQSFTISPNTVGSG